MFEMLHVADKIFIITVRLKTFAGSENIENGRAKEKFVPQWINLQC